MNAASKDLISEHKAIQIALNILEKIQERLGKNGEADYKDIIDLLDFLKEFADKCHHGKEEVFLFPALEKAGVKKEGGPIGVMLQEHTKGRNLIKEMQENILNNPVNKTGFITAASEYVRHMRAHIEKENTVLFPMIDTRMSASEQKELAENFENHEKKVIGEGRHEELHALLDKFRNKYLN
jgi:hemerythrin-like domain-containing protein